MSGVQIPPPRPLNNMKEFLEEMLGNPFGINKFLNLKYLSSNDDEHYFSVIFDDFLGIIGAGKAVNKSAASAASPDYVKF